MLGYDELAVFHFINFTLANPVFDIIMPLVTKLGSGEFIFILAVFIIFLGGKEKRMGGILLLAGLTAGYFAVDFMKANIAMPRPCMSISDIRLLVPRPSGCSFPSGHAFNAFMVSAIMTKFFKKDWIWYSLAALVAFSRVYVGAHYGSDVLIGGLIGMITGYILYKVAEAPKAA